MDKKTKTLIVDNFGGRLTRINNGKINSGLAKMNISWGYDPFSYPNQLSWNEKAIQIDPSYSVLTDMIMAGKERVESGISYLYCVGHTGRVYKIQINDLSSYNPNYDNPVLLTTLTINSPTFTRGASIEFFGSTERIYIGHDKGVTQLNFDGSGESFMGVLGSWTQSVPRPMTQFVGSLWIGNGSNLAQIDSTLTVVTYAKFSPAFNSNTQTRDLDVSPDGNYLHIVQTRLALPDLTSTTQDTTFLSNAESYIYKWNGSDIAITSYSIFPSFSLNANCVFGDWQYTFGYDLAGSCVFNPTEKILSPVLSQSPLPNAVNANGNIVGWFTPEFYNGFNRMTAFIYGALDKDVTVGLWKQYAQAAQGTETDVIRVPFTILVSNFGIGSSTNGYTGGLFSCGKGYFSTLETSSSPTTKYKLYKYFPVPTTVLPVVSGVYETQTQLFSKKVLVSEVRIYGKPWVANNSFKVDLIGSDGNPITNASYTYTAGTNLTIGNDYAWYNPNHAATYAIGLRITNLGTANNVISKTEIDYSIGGK